ncbi:MAG: T9SS type A sorting domain-containing protein [Candidatus Marinimicrobia bacterium]|nr:T9SS type A sorting domain-containing protein [Candidatus Neomarinimicrobiota bacterium]MBT3629976.1 T9SS type A sorting domain-containing protein [Candidatus Neomarinimicrobiota bacterium]MBT3825535.1 T9SS type A sorting domain-containing protein [Candidatus Neomarinimicrobiota bacterium]MBT4130961.1 T9SS type A sorting domain-containing protein [Candidatus Neomarinimicrobiota bacterium]MBT4294970.1 T9SS type A sorting domain-containing protein [Candidatus Neomarinimicrobiota bacterium]
MKRLFSNGWVFVLVMLMATGAFADRKIAPTADCDLCLKTSADGTLAVNWNAETIASSSLRDEEALYHDGSFEGQIGCGGGCGFSVRFTADTPIFLTGLTLYTQGGTATAAIVSIFADPASGIAGPPTQPVGPGDATALWESEAMDLTSPAEPTSQFDIVLDNLVLEAGDYYVVVWENSSGFLGIANDLQLNNLDRNWVEADGIWGMINDVTVPPGDPTLVGNFGITATFLPQEIEGSYMTVDTRNINFGVLQLADGPVTTDVTIGNIGLDPFDVTAITIDGLDFSTTLLAPVTVLADSFVVMDVTLTPSAEGAVAGTYTITSNADNVTEIVINASAMVFDGFPEYMVWNPSSSVSGPAFTDALGELGYTAVESPDLFLFGDPLDVDYSAVFICLGIYSDNYVLQDSSAEVLALMAFADAGKPLYMEGGDTWAYDPQTSLHPYFGVDGVADGSADLSAVVGQNLIAGMDYSYSGGNSFIDHLGPLTPDAQIIHMNPFDSVGCGIGNLTPSMTSIGNSFEFGGLGDSIGTTTELLSEYLDFFATTYTDVRPPVISGVTQFTFTLDTEGPYAVEAYIADNVEMDFAIIFYNVNGGTFSTASLSDMGDGIYSGGIPGQPVGSTVGYYIMAFDSEGNEGFSPEGSPAELYFFDVVSHLPPMFLEATSGLDGTVDLSWLVPGTEAPALVECADFPIPSLPFNTTGTNLGMGDDFDLGFDGEDVAYQLNVMVPSTYTISLCAGTNYDSRIAVFTEDCETATIYANDDACGLQSELTGVYLDPGTYLVIVDGFGTNTGTYTLDIWEETTQATAEFVPPGLTEDIGKLLRLGIDPSSIELDYSPTDFNTLRDLRQLMNYGIYRSEASPVLIEAGNQIAVIDTLPLAYTDFPLVNGTSYFYRVSAIYDDGESASSEVEGVPMNHEPMIPTGLVGTVDDITNDITLDWNDNTDYDLAGYYVYRDGEYAATVTAPTSTYTENLIDGAYQYVVSSFDTGDMESDNSERIQLLVGEVPPSELRADGFFDDHVELTWRVPGNPAPPLMDCADELIPSLPFEATGSTVGMGDDFNVSDFGGDTDDYAYQLFMPVDGNVDITLCGPTTDYDTRLEVFNAVCVVDDDGRIGEAARIGIDYHDDDGPFGSCPESPATLAPSELLNLFLPEGVYFVVVDGFGTNSGNYEISVAMSETARLITRENPVHELKKLVALGQLSKSDALEAISQLNVQTDIAPHFLGLPDEINQMREIEDITHYNVYRDGSVVGTTTETIYNDAVEEDLAYFYQVTATYDNGEESAPTNLVEARANMAPAPPTGLYVEDTGHTVTMTWQDPLFNMDGSPCYDLEGLEVRRNGALISTVDVFEWSFMDYALPDGHYVYEISAFDEVPNHGAAVSADVWVGPKPVIVQVLTDTYPLELSWNIYNSSTQIVAGIAPGDMTEASTLYEWVVDLEPGTYVFEMNDTFGDGIYVPGYYQVLHGVNILVGPNGGDFDNQELTPFVVESTILLGDLDGDGFLNILDVSRFIEIVTETGPDPTFDELALMDLNGDGNHNVLDVVVLIEAVLNTGGLAKDIPLIEDITATIAPITLNNTREWQTIPVTVDCFEMVAGFQADLVFDPTTVELGIPVLAEVNQSVGVFTSVNGNTMRVLAIDLAGNMIDLASGLLMDVPVQVIDENATGSMDFAVEDLIISGPGGVEIVAQCLVSVIDIGLPAPTEFSLQQNYPNPFNPTTNIRYDIAERGDAHLVIYNMLGQEVRSLVNGNQNVGRYEVEWNGLDNSGQPVATGIYIYHLQAGGYSKTIKMAYIK